MNISRNFAKKCVLLCIAGVFLLPLARIASGQTLLRIAHKAPTCVAVGSSIVMSATIQAATPLQDARVYFRLRETAPFYFVPMSHQHGALYTGILPPPAEAGSVIEYFILGAGSQANASKSQTFYTIAYPASECPGSQSATPDDRLIVYAEQNTPAGIGFAGDRVQWETSDFAGNRYFSANTLDSRRNQTPQQAPASPEAASSPEAATSSVEEADSSLFPALNKKTVIGVGVGLGTLAAAALVVNMIQKEDTVNWVTSFDDPARKVEVEIIKIPNVQTRCGTLVTNQLYVTNNRSERLTIESIEYEVVLTKDRPKGSCNAGRLGTFVTNWATVVQPGERGLIREWANDVNPCSNCPYLNAKCEWTSRYIVHTSAGSADTETKFVVEGDLCAAPAAAKTSGQCAPIQGDIEP